VALIDWDEVGEYLYDAKGIAFDTCHKIYVLMDDEQLELMRKYKYDEIRTTDELSYTELLDTLKKWFNKSCSLRFIQAVETNHADPNAGFTTLIEQGATQTESCEDCLSDYCNGSCDWDDEDDEDEDED
jgi:hypothetical protein